MWDSFTRSVFIYLSEIGNLYGFVNDVIYIAWNVMICLIIKYQYEHSMWYN